MIQRVDITALTHNLHQVSMNDPIVHKLVKLLTFRSELDATELIAGTIIDLSKINKDLFQRCVNLASVTPQPLQTLILGESELPLGAVQTSGTLKPASE